MNSFTRTTLMGTKRAGDLAGFVLNKKPLSRDMPVPRWSKYANSVLVAEYLEPEPRERIAAFDLDGTLITTKSGKRFHEHKADYRLLFPTIPKTLKRLHDDGYKIVILSNQNGVAKGHVVEGDLQYRIGSVLGEIGVPALVLCALQEDRYRKPMPGMWMLLEDGYNDDMVIDLTHSFYCGDLAGRVGARKDAGDTDRKLALNVGVPFQTPEELFLGAGPAQYELKGIDPHDIGRNVAPEAGVLAPAATQEMILVVGSPASGKSTFCRRLEGQGYVRINQDTLKTAARCIKETTSALKAGRSVAIDNTNPDRPTRQRYITIAQQAGVRVRCIVHTAAKDVCFHNNTYRAVFCSGDSVPPIAIHSYFKRYEPPHPSEGISEIVYVPFVPEFGGDTEAERNYRMWLR